MEISITTLSADTIKSGCIAVAVYEQGKLSPSAKRVDKASSGRLARFIKQSPLEGKPGQQLLLHGVEGVKSDRVLLLGTGKAGRIDASKFEQVAQTAVSGLRNSGTTNAAVYLDEVEVSKRDRSWKTRVVSESLHQAIYRFSQLKSDKSPDSSDRLTKLLYAVKSSAGQAAARQALRQANAIGTGCALARTLGDLPGNICTLTRRGDLAASTSP